METKTIKLRLAFRHEGNWWNAYLADMATMDGAHLIGSILFGVVQNPAHKQAFMNLMKAAFADAVKEVTGQRPSVWDERTAPESERAGHG